MRITLTKEKETKNAVRYKEDSEEQVIGTVYVKKTALDTLGNPDKVTVTVEAA